MRLGLEAIMHHLGIYFYIYIIHYILCLSIGADTIYSIFIKNFYRISFPLVPLPREGVFKASSSLHPNLRIRLKTVM